eukprot:scaffold107371_cov53-Phaeocystis_antarctica.AAC.3
MLAGSPIDILPTSSGTAIGDQCAAKKEATPIMARRPFLISLTWEMAGRWRGDGGEIVGRWQGDGRER